MTRILTPVLLCLCASAALGEVEVEVRYGHGGQSIAGALTPVVVAVTNREREPIEVAAEVRVNERYPGGEICRASAYLSAGASKELLFHLRPPTLNTMSEQALVRVDVAFDRTVRIVEPSRKDRPPARSFRFDCVPGDRPMGTSDGPEALQVLAVGRGAALPDSLREFIRVLRVDETALPSAWFAYDSLDTVLWRNPGEVEALDPNRVRALLRWVHLGGRLVVVCTRRPDLIEGTALAEVLPATFARPVPRHDYTEIVRELAGGAPAKSDGAWDTAAPFTRLLRIRGEVDESVGIAGEAISVTGRIGLGTVSVLAFDPAAFARSDGLLAANVTDLILGGQYVEEIRQGREDTTFFIQAELSEQDYMSSIMTLLRSGALKPPPMILLSLFMILYVLAVGPLDYLFLKKRGLLKYSALSFLLLAVVFSATAYFVSFHLFSGGAKANHITLVDIVPDDAGDGTEHVSIQDFAGFYAPRGITVELSQEADTLALSQFTRPREYGSWGGGGLATEPLRIAQDAPMRPTGEISVPFRSLRTVRSVAYNETVFPLEVGTEDGNYVVTSGLGFDLEGAVIVSRSGFIPLGKIPAGGTVTKSTNFGPFRPAVYGDPIEKGELPAAPELELDSDADDPGRAELFDTAKKLMAISLASHFATANRGEVMDSHLRVLRKWGVDRGPALQRGATILLAYSTERDPFGLPGADDDGFTITVLRKVLDR